MQRFSYFHCWPQLRRGNGNLHRLVVTCVNFCDFIIASFTGSLAKRKT